MVREHFIGVHADRADVGIADAGFNGGALRSGAWDQVRELAPRLTIAVGLALRSFDTP